MTRPPVSWLLPVRDGARWLDRCVRSVLVECVDDDEVIVVDDGSSDAPEAVLPGDSRVRLLRQAPLGIVAALERGRAGARHGLLARIDADDVVLPGRIEAQARLLAERPEVAVVGGGAELVGEGSAPGPGMLRYVAWVNGLHTPDELRRSVLVESPLYHPAVLMRAAVVDAVGGYREGDLPEDYDLWLRILGAGHGLAAVDRPVVRITDRPGRLTRADPRYHRKAFARLERAWVDAHLLPEPARVVVWGAGRTGRPWIRHLVERGHDVPVIIDPFQVGGNRRGIPIQGPEALVGLDLDLLLVAAGAQGARDLIRDELARLRPDLVEGERWWAVA